MLLFYLFSLVFAFLLPALLWLSFACSLLFAFALFVSLWLFVGVLLGFLFPFGLHAKRKGAPCWCVLSCPVVGLLCKIGFSALIKLVIIGLNVF